METGTTTTTSFPYAAPLYENAAKSRLRIPLWLWLPISLLVLLVAGAVLAFHAYFAWMLARPDVAPLSSNPALAVGLAYEDVRFTSSDGASTLEGWFIPSPGSEKAVIFSHGYGGNREELWVPLYQLARELNRNGYHVLMFDYSYVRPDIASTGGVRESLELQGALDFVKHKGIDRTYVWGFSMGAGTALQTALFSQDIEAMILDSTFVLEPDTLFHNIQQQLDVPRFPTLPLIRFFFPLVNGTSLDEIPVQAIKQHAYSMPILFLHGMEDERAPYQTIQELASHQTNHPLSDFWLLAEGKHELLYRYNKKAYLSRVKSFLDSVENRPQ